MAATNNPGAWGRHLRWWAGAAALVLLLGLVALCGAGRLPGIGIEEARPMPPLVHAAREGAGELLGRMLMQPHGPRGAVAGPGRMAPAQAIEAATRRAAMLLGATLLVCLSGCALVLHAARSSRRTPPR